MSGSKFNSGEVFPNRKFSERNRFNQVDAEDPPQAQVATDTASTSSAPDGSGPGYEPSSSTAIALVTVLDLSEDGSAELRCQYGMA